MRISDWSSDVCSSDLSRKRPHGRFACAWLSWRHIPSVFCAARESEPLQDLVKLCERMNLRFFDRRIHFESVPAINWHFQRRELQYDWLPASRVPIQWRFRSEEHTYELQALMRISYAVFDLK